MKFNRLLLGLAVATGAGLPGIKAQAAEGVFTPYELTYKVTRSVQNADSITWINLPDQTKTISVKAPIPDVTGFNSNGDMIYNLSTEFPDYLDWNKQVLSPVLIPKDEKHVYYEIRLQAKYNKPKLHYVLENPDTTRSSKHFTEYHFLYGTVDGTFQPRLSNELKSDYDLVDSEETKITNSTEPIETVIHRKSVTFQATYVDRNGEIVSAHDLPSEFTVPFDQVKEKLTGLSKQLSDQNYQVDSPEVTYDEGGNGKVQFSVEKNAENKPKPDPEPETKPDGETKPDPKPETKPEEETKPEPGTKPGVKPDTNLDTKPEVKPDTKPEVKPDTKPDTKPEIKPDTNPDTKPEVKPDTKPETKPEPAPKPDPVPEIIPKPIYIENNPSVSQSPAFKELLDRFMKLMDRYTNLLEKQNNLHPKKAQHKKVKTKQHKNKVHKTHKKHKKSAKSKEHQHRSSKKHTRTNHSQTLKHAA